MGELGTGSCCFVCVGYEDINQSVDGDRRRAQ